MEKKRILHITILILIVFSMKAQIATEYGMPIKWDRNNSRSNYLMKGLDTISLDSILIDRDKYLRQNANGKILEEIVFSNLNKSIGCDDEGPKLTGYWTSFYKTGEIKEIGKIVCNHKFGAWLYFYESGQIKKFEKFDGLDIVNSNPNIGYLNGSYLEYHPNGRIKITGSYKIIEVNEEYSVFDYETYKIHKECCTWSPKAIKFGKWFEYDNLGGIVKSELYNISVKDSTNMRELADRYLEININEIRKK